jgi:DNA-directed RNA polymerase III subunit RPC7
LQTGFATRLRRSAYFVVETLKSNGLNDLNYMITSCSRLCFTDLERYSDKYRQSLASQPMLKRKELHAPFFPTEIFEGYFNPKKRRKGQSLYVHLIPLLTGETVEKKATKRLNLDDLEEDAEEQVRYFAYQSAFGALTNSSGKIWR